MKNKNQPLLFLVGLLALFFALPSMVMAQDQEEGVSKRAGSDNASDTVRKNVNTPPIEADLREIGRFKKVFRHEKLRQGIAPEDQSHFSVSARISREGGGPIGLWYGEGEDRQKIPVGEDGKLSWRPSAALFKANPLVFTDVPKGQLSMRLGMHPILPMEEKDGHIMIKSDDLRLALKQANRAIGKAAGVASFAVPKMKKIIIRVPDGETPMMHFLDGQTRPMAMAAGLDGWYVFDSKDRSLKKLDYISASAILESNYWN